MKFGYVIRILEKRINDNEFCLSVGSDINTRPKIVDKIRELKQAIKVLKESEVNNGG